MNNYINPRIYLYLFIIIITFQTASLHAQYLHASGTRIVNGSGEPVILRGMGLGGWMLQEGYMLQTNGFADTQHEIRAAIEDLIGPDDTETFYQTWRAHHCTRGDIDSLAAWGFNAVRLPMHYNLFTLPVEEEPIAGQQTWLTTGFALTDSLVKWCKANDLYVILDLHAAPGGQGNDLAISDRDPDRPSLWESEANQQKTIALWRKLAERYADEPTIGGYDLINEPNWNFTEGAHANGCDEATNAPLRQLYIDITNAIRAVDTHHIIFVEGNCWANNHNGLMPPWDDNLVASYHKYWTYNTDDVIQGYLDERNTYNVPLWLGEAGENSNDWFTDAIALHEQHDIGWAWWPLKKVGTVVNPLTIVNNDGYQNILAYWKDGAARPSPTAARDALMQLADDLHIRHNIYRPDVPYAMIQSVQSDALQPYTAHTFPGVVHATDYDLGRNEIAYLDHDEATYHVNTGTYVSWNQGYAYRNDGVDIEASADTDEDANGYNVGWTEDGEWLKYTVNIDSSAAYNLTIRYAAQGAIRLQCDGTDITGTVILPETGGYQQWANITQEDVPLTKGKHVITLRIVKGGFNLAYLRASLSKKLSEVAMAPVSGEVSDETTRTLYLTLNKRLGAASMPTAAPFSITLNGVPATIAHYAVNEKNPYQLTFTLVERFHHDDEVAIRYAGTAIQADDGTALATFQDFIIANNLPVHYRIPGQLEAEDFAEQSGLALETTTDTNGGQNIGYTDAGDYLRYRIRVSASGTYAVTLRVAAESQAGQVQIIQWDEDGNPLQTTTVNLPVTGGWQTWQNVVASMPLQEGYGWLEVKVMQAGFNLNWLAFAATVINGIAPQGQGSLRIFPNPASEQLEIEIPEGAASRFTSTFSLHTLLGTVVQEGALPTGNGTHQLNLSGLAKGLYIIQLKQDHKTWQNRVIIY